MDDLQLFLESKRWSRSYLREARPAAGYREYESVDLGRRYATTLPSQALSSSANSGLTCCCRCNLSQRLRDLDTYIGHGTPSKWHRALEKLDEKRKWRHTSAELSEALEKWLRRQKAADFQDGEVSVIIGSETHEPSVLMKQATVSICEVNGPTTPTKVIIETTTVAIETGGDSTDVASDSDSGNDAVKTEDIHKGPLIKVEVAEIPSDHEAIDTITPARSTKTSSSTTSSPTTPRSSPQPKTIMILTPDTPKSALQSYKKTNVASDPDTPTPKRFEYPPLPEDIFLPRSRDCQLNPGDRLRAYHGLPRRRSPSPVVRNLKGRPQTRDLSPSSRSDPQVTLFSEGEIRAKRIRPAKNEAAVHKSSSKGAVIRQQGGAVVIPSSISIFQPKFEVIITEAGKRKTEFTNSLQVYDKAKQDHENDTTLSMWSRFNTKAIRCYGKAKSARRRCLRQSITGTEDSIRKAIERLEAHDPEADYEGCLRLIEELTRLTLCEQKGSGWSGHIADSSQILVRCKSLLAGCEQSDKSSIVAKAMAVNEVALIRAGPNVVTRQTARAKANAFSGFVVWQPKRSLGMDVNSKLREVALRPVKYKNKKNSGYIYAYRTECIFGLVKIGYTTRDIETRLKEWKKQCGHTPLSVLGSTGRLAYVGRVEDLIHAELKDCRRKQTKCCEWPHDEWFETTVNNVRAIVEKWSIWMRSEPYDAKGILKAQHRLALDKWCQPTEVRPEVDGARQPADLYVRSLEKSFHFSVPRL